MCSQWDTPLPNTVIWAPMARWQQLPLWTPAREQTLGVWGYPLHDDVQGRLSIPQAFCTEHKTPGLPGDFLTKHPAVVWVSIIHGTTGFSEITETNSIPGDLLSVSSIVKVITHISRGGC